MTLACQDISPDLVLWRPASARLSSDIAGQIADLGAALAARGVEVALLDLRGCSGGHSLLAGLVEGSARLGSRLRLVVCGLDPALAGRLDQAGLAGALDLAADPGAALALPFVAVRLAVGSRAVLAPGWGLRPVLPLSGPAALLDILGMPAIARAAESLRRVGIRDIVLDAGGAEMTGATLAAALPATASPWFLGGAAPGALAAALAGQARRGGMTHETVLFAADSLPGPGLGDAILSYRQSGAALGLAAGDGGANALAIASAGVLAAWAESDGTGTTDPLSGLLSGSGHPADPALPARAAEGLASAGDYFRLLCLGLDGRADLCPVGAEVRPGVWLAAGAYLSPRARIAGRCYIGPGARVEAGATLSGHVVIGAGAVVDPGAMIRESVIRPDTRVTARAVVTSLIASGTWAVDHRFRTVSTTVPQEGVVPAGTVPAATKEDPRARPEIGALPLLARTA